MNSFLNTARRPVSAGGTTYGNNHVFNVSMLNQNAFAVDSAENTDQSQVIHDFGVDRTIS